MRWLPLASAFAGALLAPGLAAAQTDPDDAPTRQAIQRRKYELNHELRISVGSLPLDAYQKGWSASLGYTRHLNEYLSWEVFQVSGALLTSTDLRDELLLGFAAAEEDFAAPRFLVTTGIELTPFYGKQAVMNGAVGHHALFLGAYTGVAFGDRGDFSSTLEDVRPLLGLGIGYRVFVSEGFSVRFDARDFLSFRRAIRADESFEVENILFLTLSLSFSFGGEDA